MELQDIVNWLMDFSKYGYFGIFLISLIGASSIIFPIPSAVIIFTLAGIQNQGVYVFDPLWIAVAGGLGAAVGEFTSYAVGYGGRRIVGKKYQRKFDLLVRVFNRFGPIVIFLFALTPLPDDLIFIPLGVMRYSFPKAFVSALSAKFLMTLIVAYSGRFSVKFIADIFGEGSTWMSVLIGMILSIVLMIIAFVVMFKVDWEKHLERYLSKLEKNERERAAVPEHVDEKKES